MAASDGTNATGTIEVFTFKRGMLSRLAHDLCLKLGRFEIQAADGKLSATFWPDSLEVQGVMHDGRLDKSALSAAQCAEIQGNIRDQILRTRQHATATFTAVYTVAAAQCLRGQLDLAGSRVALEVPVTLSAGRVRGEVELQPTRWGIAPFKALMGAIQLQDRVLVRFDVPAPAA